MADLRSVKYKGGFFETEKNFNFFGLKDKNVQGSLIFGRNGSGKSTLTKLTRMFKESSLPDNSSVTFYDRESNDISLNVDKNGIYIFDEDFIDDNIKFKSNDGLETIVMIGDQIDVEEKIQIIQESVIQLEKSIVSMDISIYDDPKSVLSPHFYEKSIIDILKSDRGWARIDSDIKGNKNKSAVNTNVISQIIQSNNGKKELEIRDQFKKDYEYFETIRSYDETLDLFEIGDELNFPEDELIQKLGQELEKPIGDKWVDRLNNVSSEFGTRHALNISTYFTKNKDYCPYCLRDISSSDIENIINAVRIQQNIDVEVYRLEVDGYRRKEINIDNLESYSILPENNIESIYNLITKYNKIVASMNQTIDERLDDIFKVVLVKKTKIKDIEEEINKEVSKLNLIVNKFNNDVDNSNEIKNKLINLNMELHYHDIKTLYSQMMKQENEKHKILVEFNNTRTLINEKNAEIETLRNKQKNIDIAVDLLNRFLGIIFLSKERLKVQLSDGQYKILSNNKVVAKQNLSTGERNAIALCYFFSLMNVGLPVKFLFTRELNVYIDDPVSSFDIENRIGIFSFLKTVLGDIVKGNEKSKIIVFSHKIDVYLDLIKVFSDISNDTEFIYECNKLENQELKLMKSKNIYTILLKDIYKYSVNGVDDSESMVIGNKMRRVLESFSSFNYGISSIELTKQGMIDEKIKNPNLNKYFTNFMQRLLLNNESHMEETIYSIETQTFYTYIDFTEKLITAKSVICLLYLFDKTHVVSHLFNLKDDLSLYQDKSVIICNIEGWIEDIA